MTRPRRQRAAAAPAPRPHKQPDQAALALAHEIGNMLGALELRLQVVRQSSVCRQAQGENLDAMAHILEAANDLVQQVAERALAGSIGAEPRPAPGRKRARSAPG